MNRDSDQDLSQTPGSSGERASNESQLSSPSEPEESIAFKAGREARAQQIPITQSALRMIRPGTDRYYDFMDGYDFESDQRKRTKKAV